MRERSIFQKSDDDGNLYEDSPSPRQRTVSKGRALHVEESNNQSNQTATEITGGWHVVSGIGHDGRSTNFNRTEEFV